MEKRKLVTPKDMKTALRNVGLLYVNTSLHLADVRAEYPGKHTVTESSAIQFNGQRIWKSYETLAVDGEDFPAIGEAFERTGQVRHVPLGNGMLSMMCQRALVDFAVKWIGENRK